MSKKFRFMAAGIAAVMMFSSCAKEDGGGEITENEQVSAFSESVAETAAEATSAEMTAETTVAETAAEADNFPKSVREELPASGKPDDIVRSPMEAAENYLNDMCGKDGIVSVSITGVKVPQTSDGIAAARYGRCSDPNEYIILVLADYSLEYAEGFEEESAEKSEWIAVKSSPERGFYFYESFPNEPHSFIGTVSEVLEDNTFTIVPDEGSPELEIAESFTLQVYPVPDTPPENIGDRVRVTYNGSITIDENGLPHIEKIIVYTDNSM